MHTPESVRARHDAAAASLTHEQRAVFRREAMARRLAARTGATDDEALDMACASEARWRNAGDLAA